MLAYTHVHTRSEITGANHIEKGGRERESKINGEGERKREGKKKGKGGETVSMNQSRALGNRGESFIRAYNTALVPISAYNTSFDGH